MVTEKRSKRKKGSGIRLAIFGLGLGAALGLLILAAQVFLARELMDLLEEEVRASCDCTLRYEDVKVSLLRLRGAGKNISIYEKGDNSPKLTFSQVYASFGLQEILDGVIHLENIQLLRGHADGVSPSSVTFRFIDRLTEPPSEESDNLISVKLHKLQIFNSSLIERFHSANLVSEGISMNMERTPKGNFLLRPIVQSSAVVSNHSNFKMPLGGARAELMIYDDHLHFQKVHIDHGSTQILSEARSLMGNAYDLSGDFTHDLHLQDLNLFPWLFASYAGEGSYSGTLGDPKFTGEFSTTSEPLVKVGGVDILQLKEANGTFLFDYNKGIPILALDALSASGDNGKSVQLQTPVKLIDDAVSGKLRVSADQAEIGGVQFESVDLTVDISGHLGSSLTSVDGRGRVVAGTYRSPTIWTSIDLSSENILFSFRHSSRSNGTLKANGELTFIPEGLYVDTFHYSLRDFIFSNTEGESEDELAAMRISGVGDGKGRFHPDHFEAQGTLKVSSRDFEGESALQGSASIANGRLQTEIANKSKSFLAKLGINFSESTGNLQIQANKFTPVEYDPSLECLLVTFNADYTFSLYEPSAGDGSLSVSNIEAGCNPYVVKLNKPFQSKISKGNLNITPILFTGKDTALKISGSTSLSTGYNLSAVGAFQLRNLVYFFPSVDDMRGLVNASLKVTGPLNKPDLVGDASIRKVEIGVEALNISATKFNGSIRLDTEKIEIYNLVGSLNGGLVRLNGIIFPFELQRSGFSLDFADFLFDSVEDLFVNASGNIQLIPTQEGGLDASGEILISNAELRKNFDLATALRLFSDYIFSSPLPEKLYSSDLPLINLHVDVKAPQNLFFISNLGAAQLSADLTITGTLQEPQILGTSETLDGWFGFKERRFRITSGTIRFEEDSAVPQIDIFSESYIPTQDGSIALVFLELSGAINNPDSFYSSDQGLSQRQILALIAEGGPSQLDTAGLASLEPGFDVSRFLKNLQDFRFERALRMLASIDSIFIEPRYNTYSGTTEPTIVAQKDFSNSFYLLGETSLSQDIQRSAISANYLLTDTITASTGAETVSERENSALTADLSVTLLSRQGSLIDISIEGNEHFSSRYIRDELKINRVSKGTEINLSQAEGRLESLYQDEGFPNAHVSISLLHDRNDKPSEVKVTISEGSRSNISGVVFDGDSIYQLIIQNSLELPKPGAPATKELRENVRKQVLNFLRAEGFLGARITSVYGETDSTGARPLSINVRTGAPVTFIFEGNTIFDANDFLETINLFSRTQPFGNNTIAILIENIERLYREAGYLYTTIRFSKNKLADSRNVYTISIQEEQQIFVETVSISGMVGIPQETLMQAAEQYERGRTQRILSPRFVVHEQLLDNIRFLENLYRQEGYPNVRIEYHIHPGSESNLAQIEYSVVEGKSQQAASLITEGIPEYVDPPIPPSPPYSELKADEYTRELLRRVKSSGHLNPDARRKRSGDSIVISITPKERWRVGEISLAGNSSVSDVVIWENITLTSGDYFTREGVDEIKRDLLKLGLFAQVEIETTDSSTSDFYKDLIITVRERPLQDLKVGVGVNSELGLRLFSEASDRGLFADGKSLALRLDGYYLPSDDAISQGLSSIRYTNPSISRFGLRHSQELRYQKIERINQEFDVDRVSFVSSLYESFSSAPVISLSHIYSQDSLDNVTPGAILSDLDQGSLDLSMFTTSIVVDKRNHPLNPTRGFTVGLDARFSSEQIGSDANYYSVGGFASFIAPITIANQRFFFASNTRGATSFTFGDTEQVPITQRYYLGGRTSLRGFRENSLGPKGPDGAVIGGDALVQNNTELRYIPIDSFSVHLFIDNGTVYLRDRSFDTDDIRTSVGFGLRYLSPIGPVGFDIGHPLDERSGEPSFRAHFSVGTIF